VKHSLASSEYNNRRASCEEGVEIIKNKNPEIDSLRDISLALLISKKDKMSADTFLKCLYVVEEIERTQKAAGHLKAGNLLEFGELMYQTHEGLSQLYEVSCTELDFLATWAKKNKDLIVGARMMGGGFGGCTINLIKKEATIALTDEIKAKYFATFKTEPKIYPIRLKDGVRLTSTLSTA
jgi:galactokinase